MKTHTIVLAIAMTLSMMGCGPSGRRIEPAGAADARLAATGRDGQAHRTAQDEDREGEQSGAIQAAEQRTQMRLDDDGEIKPAALLRAKSAAERMRELDPPGDGGVETDGGIWTWEYLGPDNIGGRCRAVCFATNSTIYLGSVSGGVWKSVDTGANWANLGDFLPSLAITSIVTDPADPNRVFIATGEGFAVNNRAAGAGVFRSTNGGQTWTQLPGTAGWAFTNRLAVRPGTQTLFAAVGDGTQADPQERGVWRSANWGADWEQVLAGEWGYDVKVSPSDPNRILVGTASGVFLSTSGGAPGSFVEQTNGGAGKLPMDANRCEVTFGANGWMWVSMWRGTDLDNDAGTDDMEIWRSTDGGVSWTKRHTGTNYANNYSSHCNTIWASPDDPNLIIVGGVDLWRSTNGGTTLTRISGGSGSYYQGTTAHGDQHIIVSPPNYGPANRRVYVGNDGGIQRMTNVYTVTENSGWTNLIHGVGITQFYHGAAHKDGYFLGGSQDNGSKRLRPGEAADQWTHSAGGDGCACAINHNDASIQYASWQFLNIMKSTNGGDSFSDAVNGLSDAGDKDKCPFIARFIMDPTNPDILVAGSTSIWRTANAAGNWVSIRGPIDNDPNVADPKCTAMDIAKTNSNRIWVGYSNGVVSRTTSSVSTWTNVDAALPDRAITDIAINPTNSNEVFVTIGGFVNDTVWYTSDAGATWAQRTGSGQTALPPVHVNTITYHPLNTNWVYVGTDLGVYASENKGLTWNRTPRYDNAGHDGPINAEVAELFWQGTEHLCAATHGRGMWRVRALPVVYVDQANGFAENGSQLFPYNTFGEGYGEAGNGTTISIEAADYAEGPRVLSKRVRIVGTGGVVRLH